MKKIATAFGLAIVVVGGAAAVPLYVGNKAESFVSEGQSYEYGQVALSHVGGNFERGYLSSRADATLSLRVEDEVLELAAVHEIEHLVAPRIVSRFRVLPGGGELQRALYGFFGDDPILVAQTQLTAKGSRTELSIPEVEETLSDGLSRLHFGGMSGIFSTDDTDFSGNFDVRPISFTGEGRSLVIGDQKLTMDLGDIDELVHPGTGSYLLKRAELHSSEGTFALDDLRVSSSSSVVDINIDTEALIELEALETPHSRIEGMSARLAVDNMHREIMEFMVGLDAKSAEEFEAIAPEVIRPMVLRFLENMPGANMEFVWGPSTDAKAAVNWDLLYRLPEGRALDLDRPNEVIAGIDTTAVLSFKSEFIEELSELSNGALGTPEELQAMLTMLESEGFLVRDEHGYRSKIGFSGGQFLVNDIPRPELMMMLGLFLMQ